MAFTDEDLVKLKEQIARPEIHGEIISFDFYSLEKIINRLEAAEEALMKYESSEGDTLFGVNVLEKWRKSCGK